MGSAEEQAASSLMIDFCAPRRVNAQAIILQQDRERPGKWQVLLQLRSERMQMMPNHLAAIGGCRSAVDPDSRATCLREVQEECGLLGGIAVPPCKFAEGGKCDWYVIKVKDPVFKPHAETQFECGDIRVILPLLPASTCIADCYGHAWLPTDDLDRIDKRLPLMGGLLGRVSGAVRHMCAVEQKLQNQMSNMHSDVVKATLQSSGIGIGEDGSILSCPAEDTVCQPSKQGKAICLGALRTQLEYYLSDGNLRHDKFFYDIISKDAEGWLELSNVLACNKIKSMGATQSDIVSALQASELEVREDGSAIRRANNDPLPLFQAKKSMGIQRKGASHNRLQKGQVTGEPGKGKGKCVGNMATQACEQEVQASQNHASAVQRMCAVEEKLQNQMSNMHSDVVNATLHSSGIGIGEDGRIVSCPAEDTVSHPSNQGNAICLGALRTQLEYYLSDGNLRHDKFFYDIISKDAEGWLELSNVLACNKIKSMGARQSDIVSALQASELEVREDGSAIRRSNNDPLPLLQAKESTGIQRKGASHNRLQKGQVTGEPGKGKGKCVGNMATQSCQQEVQASTDQARPEAD
eukprot:TRINITY_DN6027_c0_g1_i1.p1 TRINITY_DN6027_c0_g1~~TRINITY_DN6027_c0_g1_i1.p1  ORF type:complete len:580 (+),score=93.88 TRINITY_DN6027_c0_g1_i1:63-1802(+)